jgi:tRNA (cmo5U34)-methyltransferase
MSNWDPSSYLNLIHEEIPDYDELQNKLVEATKSTTPKTILELGTGSGETARRLLDAHPEARLHGIDSSVEMLDAARGRLPAARTALDLGRLEDRLPKGPFGLVVAALSVHHLDALGKADLFRRIAVTLESGGRFVLADVVVPDDPADALTPLEAGYDLPSRVDEQLGWLEAAGLRAGVFWTKRDLAVVTGDAGPARP